MTGADGSETSEPAAVELWWSFLLIVAGSSMLTAQAFTYGVGYDYFRVIGVALLVLTSLVLYENREEFLEGIVARRESWRRAGEPVEPDEVIADVVDDGGDGGST